MPQFSSMFSRVSKGWQNMCPKSCGGWKLVSEGSKEEEQSFNNSEGLRGIQQNGRVYIQTWKILIVFCNTSQLKKKKLSPKSHICEMPEGKMTLPFQVKNLYHFLQSRGCTRQQCLWKAGWEHHFHSYLSKHKSRLLQSHTPCYVLHQHFFH